MAVQSYTWCQPGKQMMVSTRKSPYKIIDGLGPHRIDDASKGLDE
jgi:hypothetical protein